MGWVEKYAPLIASAAGRTGVRPELLIGHIANESNGRIKSTGLASLGELGLLQSTDEDRRTLGYPPFDVEDPEQPRRDIDAGADWYARELTRVRGEYGAIDLDYALHLAALDFAAGRGARVAFVRGVGGLPSRWVDLIAKFYASQDALRALTGHDPVKWGEHVNAFFADGARLLPRYIAAAGAGAVASPDAVAADDSPPEDDPEEDGGDAPGWSLADLSGWQIAGFAGAGLLVIVLLILRARKG